MAEPSSTTVVIPAFNEGHSIGAVVGDLLALGPWREIIVVDDGSIDDTATAARDAGRGSSGTPTTRATAPRSRAASGRPPGRTC